MKPDPTSNSANPSVSTGQPSHGARNDNALRIAAAVAMSLWIALTARSAGPMSAAIVLFVAVVVGVVLGRKLDGALGALSRIPRRIFVLACAAVAFGIALHVVRGPLAGQTGLVDAAVYLFQGRALSHGHFGAVVPAPRLAYGGRFLFESAPFELHGVFPPGYPLFLVPFLWLGVPMLAGPVVAVLLVFALDALARRARVSEAGARLALLASLASYARAIETADLVSHGFLALLSCAAVALAFAVRERPTWSRFLALGAALGWALASRLLDGVFLVAFVAVLVAPAVVTRGAARRLSAFAILGCLPFVVFLGASQKAATGSWLTPTQTAYFVRSDTPEHCHRLGFGATVGCAIEHREVRIENGDDGYGPDDAFRVTRARAEQLGRDLFGYGPLALLAFAGAIARPRRRATALVAYGFTFSLGYALFYYVGNTPLHGARHLFAVAPFFWISACEFVAAPSGEATATLEREGPLTRPRIRGALLATFVALTAFGGIRTWQAGLDAIRTRQENRAELRKTLADQKIARGILKSRDGVAVLAAADPRLDAPTRHIVVDDRAGLLDLRRAYPTLPLLMALPKNEVGRYEGLPPPPPGLHVELERAWPSFTRAEGMAVRAVRAAECCGVEKVSGENVLEVVTGAPSGRVRFPFDVITGGDFAIRIDALAAPTYGDYEVLLDGEQVARVDGYAAAPVLRQGTPSAKRRLEPGAHELELRCVGKAGESRGFGGAFDVLVGIP
jgi:hypothetical protein